MIREGSKRLKLLKNSFWEWSSWRFWLVGLLTMELLINSCGSFPKELAEAQSQGQNAGEKQSTIPPAVDVAIARKEILTTQADYIGTTTPFRTVSLRSQIEGQLLALNVDVGDVLAQGQIVGQIDDTILTTALRQAEAELAALKSEVARANTQVSNARVQLERTRLEVAQAISDAKRQKKLLQQGAIAQQSAEQAETAAQTKVQAFRAAQEQVRIEQQAVAVAKGRLTAQQAVVAQARERRSYTRLKSPTAGVVLEKLTEPGNFLQPGNEILKIGDFRRVKVIVQLSELELALVQIGQSVQVRLDAFPDRSYVGTVTRISPVANATARLLPVEIVIPNSDGKIGSGLLARVSFSNQAKEQVVVPLTAVQKLEKENSFTKETPKNSLPAVSPQGTGVVFVVVRAGSTTKVKAQPVNLGKIADNKVEIISGLQPGQAYVVRSSKPLKDGNTVRISILSEKLGSSFAGS